MASELKAVITKSGVTAIVAQPHERVAKDYDVLQNKPSINDIVLKGNKTFEDLGDHILTNTEIMELYRRVKGL